MTTYKFLVQGSSPKPYEVVFYSSENNMSATCNCNAGLNGQTCKHRLNILGGDTNGIISGNENEVKMVLHDFKNTLLEVKLNQLAKEEMELEILKKKITITKKELANVFLGK